MKIASHDAFCGLVAEESLEGRGLKQFAHVYIQMKEALLFNSNRLAGRARTFLAAFVIMLGLAQVSGCASQATQIDELMRLSGTERRLAQFHSMMQLQMTQNRPMIPPELVNTMSDALVSSFQAHDFMPTVRGVVELAYDADHMGSSLKWLNSPTGKRMLQMELDASGPAAQAAIADYAKSVETMPPTDERRQLMLKLNEATNGSLLSVLMFLASFDGVTQVIIFMMPVEKRYTDKQIELYRKRIVRQLSKPLLQQKVAELMYTYRDASDDELGRMISFYKSQGGQWYKDTIQSGLLISIEAGSVLLSKKMQPSIRKYWEGS